MSSANADIMPSIAFLISGDPKPFAREIRSGLPCTPRIAICHDDDHGLGFSSRDQVVHDEVGPPLPDPSCFVLAATVLQIKNRVALVWMRVIPYPDWAVFTTVTIGRQRKTYAEAVLMTYSGQVLCH